MNCHNLSCQNGEESKLVATQRDKVTLDRVSESSGTVYVLRFGNRSIEEQWKKLHCFYVVVAVCCSQRITDNTEQ